MDRLATRLTILGAILSPSLHSFTDLLEWLQQGFSPVQLWLNYVAFLPLPAVMLGLYAAQRPAIPSLGLLGAVGYGFAFIYFTHTTLLALGARTPNYQQLWGDLGMIYTIHGVLMLAAGFVFGVASLRARVFPPWTAWCFLAGIGLNLSIGLLPVPEIAQTLGTLLRNIGLVGMGWALARRGIRPTGPDPIR
jgi:hypothetical protein